MIKRSNGLIVLTIAPLLTLADSDDALAAEVVYKSNNTISTAPYYSAIKRKTRTSALSTPPVTADNPHHLANRIPIRSTTLRPGEPRVVEQAHQQPVFVMGGDVASREWFEREAAQLARMGAVGVVIALETQKEWAHIHRIARRHRLIVHAVEGDAIADAYQIDTYPTLIIGERIGGQ